jgi:hypothetical protein
MKPKTNRQIYIRAIELIGQWLNMDYLKVYEVDEYLKEVIKRIRKNSGKPSIHKFITTHNWGKHISDFEKVPFLEYLDYVYTNKLKKNKIERMAATDPEVLAFMALFEEFEKDGLLN